MSALRWLTDPAAPDALEQVKKGFKNFFRRKKAAKKEEPKPDQEQKPAPAAAVTDAKPAEPAPAAAPAQEAPAGKLLSLCRFNLLHGIVFYVLAETDARFLLQLLRPRSRPRSRRPSLRRLRSLQSRKWTPRPLLQLSPRLSPLSLSPLSLSQLPLRPRPLQRHLYLRLRSLPRLLQSLV